jgi:hypothetical protein
MDKLLSRLLSPAAANLRVVLLDNIKTLRLSWAELEAQVTAGTISGHRYYTGEGQRPNTLLWLLTVNSANLSKDMAQRCLIIRLKRPEHDANWEGGTWEFIERHRWAIIGDIKAELERPVAALRRHSRWGAWEAEVLARVDDPSECQKVIEERQSAVDGDRAEAEVVREAFVETLVHWRHDPETAVVRITSKEVAEIVTGATNESRPVTKVTPYVRTLGIKELRKSDRSDAKGWVWTGARAAAGAQAVPLKPI